MESLFLPSMSERLIKSFVLIISISFCLISNGQYSSLRVQSADSLSFSLKVNGKLINASPTNVVQADSLRSGKQQLDIKLKGTATQIQLEISLVLNTSHTYELRKLGDDYAVLPFSKSPIVSTKILADESINLSDTLSVDSLDFAYDGPKGCSYPASKAYINGVISSLESEIFESSRRKTIENSLKSHCLTVDQFSVLLKTIELEDYKLELASKAISKIYDKKNFMQLEGLFHLKSSKESLNKIYQSEFIEN